MAYFRIALLVHIAITTAACGLRPPNLYPNIQFTRETLLHYQSILSCSSPDLDLEVLAKHPVSDSEKNLWEADLRLRITLKNSEEDIPGVTLPLTFFWDYPTEFDSVTGRGIIRSYDDLPPPMNIDDETDQERRDRLRSLYRPLLKSFKPIDQKIPAQSLRNFFQAWRAPYSKLVEDCIYQKKS